MSKAALGTFEHYCTEKHCGGVVLEDYGRVKKMQKVSLTLDNKIHTFNNLEKAKLWAEKFGVEIIDG